VSKVRLERGRADMEDQVDVKSPQAMAVEEVAVHAVEDAQ
jgi:hypothetical protein